MGRRHAVESINSRDSLEQLALVQVARHQRASSRRQDAERGLPVVQPQTRLAHGLVRPVACVAMVRENRPHVAVERQRLAETRDAVLDRRHLPHCNLHRPCLLLTRQGPLRTGRDPGLEQLAFTGVERTRRRNLQFVLTTDRRHQQAGLLVPRHDRSAPAATDQHRRPRIEAQVPSLP